MRRLWPSLVALALAAGFSVWAYPQLPGEIATHWGVDGQPNGWSSSLLAAVLVPSIAAALMVVLLVVPRIDPRRESWELHGPTYWMMANLTLCFLLLSHVLVLGVGLGWKLPIGRLVPVAVGALFVVLGNVMPRMRPNWFMGIRTPWTLSSDEVWRRTHRIGGACFVVAGLLVALCGFVGGGLIPYVIVGAVAVSIVVPVGYSWLLWRRSLTGAPRAEP